MRSLLIALALLSACKKKAMYQGEAEAKSARIFGTRAMCVGGDKDRSGDWTCFSVETADSGGHITYRPTPIVTCIDGECTKIQAEASK